MKIVPLKKVVIDYDGDRSKEMPEFLEYRHTIMSLLKTPKDPEKGATFEETAQAMPIWLKFRDHKVPEIGDGEIMLEDAEHKFVVSCLKGARFVQRSYELFIMIKDVSDAPNHLAATEEKKG